MSLTPRALKALMALLPMGAMGISSALAAVPPKPVHQDATQVAQRLQAIRSAVSQVTADQHGLPPGDPNIQKAWWGNFGPGLGWRNGGWRNGGWGNGGWRNGGWRNAGWPNWGNGWPNGWGNGWRN
jgi:rSAM-associated Gly-rich repeat protein